MAHVYRAVMRGCGITAGVVAAAWIAAAMMSGEGTQVPRQLYTACVVVVTCGTIIGAGGWIAERSLRIGAQKYIRPVVRSEIERAFADSMPLMAATVAESLDRRIVPQMHDVAVAAGKQSAVRLRDMVTQEIRDIVNDAHRKAVVTGMAMQANATGEVIAKTALRSVPRVYVSTSRGD